MTRKDLKILFIKSDTSPNAIARKLGVAHQAIYMVLAGHTSSRRIQAELERVLGMPIEEIQRAYRNRYVPPRDANISRGNTAVNL